MRLACRQGGRVRGLPRARADISRDTAPRNIRPYHEGGRLFGRTRCVANPAIL